MAMQVTAARPQDDEISQGKSTFTNPVTDEQKRTSFSNLAISVN